VSSFPTFYFSSLDRHLLQGHSWNLWSLPRREPWVLSTFTQNPDCPFRSNGFSLLSIAAALLTPVSAVIFSLVHWRLMQALCLAGQWIIPCDTNLTMTITFRCVSKPRLRCVFERALYYSGGNYTLLPSDYLIGPTAGEPELCLTWPKASPPSSDGIDWQIGAAFLRTVYTVFRCDIRRSHDFSCGLMLYILATALPKRSPL
jgi:hypothetical protein